MAFFPDVVKGQTFTPSALLSNNVRHLINTLNGFQGHGIVGGSSGMVRIQVYNNTGADIAAGCAVNFTDGGSLCGDAVPAEPLKDATKPWGVVPVKLAAKQMGDCIISGPATVTLSGNGGKAQPSSSSPTTFMRGSSGVPVLFASGTSGMILLGGSGTTSDSEPDVILCQITCGNAQTGYTVAMYGNGPNQSSTGTGRLFVAEIAFNSTLPVGTRILGHRAMIQTTGGTV